MTSSISKPWIPLERIDSFIRLEPALLILTLAIGAWLTYRTFLKNVSEDRKQTLEELFKNLFYHLLFASTLFITYWCLQMIGGSSALFERVSIYLGILTLFSGTTVFVKVSRALVFEYFCLSHMKVAFPVLLINLFTLLLSLILAGWIGTEILNIRLAPVLATSAIFSLVLGLALQDTLGNLFSGVALQLDKPYEIGEWIEVHGTGEKWVGRVEEITWRATILVGFANESITIPNRLMGQSQIANFAARTRPVQRVQIIRLPYNIDIPKTKALLIRALKSVPDIKQTPPPNAVIMDTTESGISFKLVYSIQNYGDQFLIQDKILSAAIQELIYSGQTFATYQIQLHEPSSSIVQRSAKT